MSYSLSVLDGVLLLRRALQDKNGDVRRIAVAVYDVDGKELVFGSAHSVRSMCNNIACAKARVAASTGKTTREVRDQVASGDFDIGCIDNDMHFGAEYAGGVPIVINSSLVGAIGVSNLSEDEDEEIAQEAVGAIVEHISDIEGFRNNT